MVLSVSLSAKQSLLFTFARSILPFKKRSYMCPSLCLSLNCSLTPLRQTFCFSGRTLLFCAWPDGYERTLFSEWVLPTGLSIAVWDPLRGDERLIVRLAMKSRASIKTSPSGMVQLDTERLVYHAPSLSAVLRFNYDKARGPFLIAFLLCNSSL